MDDMSDKAAWNSAAEYCKELTLLRRYLHSARVTRDHTRRFDLLISFKTALSARFKEKKSRDFLDAYGKAQPMKIVHAYYHKKTTLEFNKFQIALKSKGKGDPSDMLHYFNLWEEQLRKDEDELGLLVPDRSDPAFALSGSSY